NSGISISNVAGGEVRLAAMLEDYFDGNSLDTNRWQVIYPNSGLQIPLIFQNGTVTVEAAGLRSLTGVQESDLPLRIEGRVRLADVGAGGFSDFGLGKPTAV